MGFKESWEKEWDITACEPGWSLTADDFLDVKGEWEPGDVLKSVTLTRIRQGATNSTWAKDCVFVSSGGKEQIEGTTELEHGGKQFVITYTTVSGGKDQLECTPSADKSSVPPAGFLQSLKRWVGRYIVRPLAVRLTILANYLEGDDLDGHAGGWAAEEGGTNAPRIVPYEARPYERLRRRA
jgi:hypothetical protein